MGLCLIGPSAALAQFSSGSTGADGALNVTASTTLDLPANGIFNYTTITVPLGVTLSFNRNALNTPVYLLATGDVLISGIIDVSAVNDANSPAAGRGGPGGFDGGFGAFQGFPSGDGQGPGGGRADAEYGAAYAFPNSGGANTSIYGNTLLSPLIGGSGGAAGTNGASIYGGGGGGGAILIASSSKLTIAGAITASGRDGSGGGSGGAIRVVAPIVDGTGSLNVAGGNSYLSGTYRGSSGRTRIDSTDRFAHRSLSLGGKGTRGSQMFVFPPNNPRLDIISAAGTAIAEGTAAPVTVNLPVGSPTAQIVRVQARGFTGDVPIRVKITPENGTAATFDAVIPAGNPSFVDVPVTLVVDTVCHVHAWTR